MSTHRDAFYQQILALPVAEREKAILRILSETLRTMSLDEIVRMRTEIATDSARGNRTFEAAINTVDGHLALRELGLVDT